MGGGGGGGGGSDTVSEAQARVAAIWSAVLGVDAAALTRASDFFAVGGSSLTAGRVAGSIRKAFLLSSFSGADVFSRRTLGDMVGRCRLTLSTPS